MAYKDRYRTYLEQVPMDIKACIESGKRHVLGYTSNLDVIVKWDTQAFNDVLKKHLKGEPSAKEGETINSMEDFARIVGYYAIKGHGGEIDICNIEVCEYLEKNFETAFSLGGTCAQGAAALNTIGFPVVAHLTDKCREVCNIINNHPNFYLITEDGPTPIDRIDSNSIPIRHMIIQYTKGDKIIANGKEYIVPDSNRVIADYDKVHKYVPIDKVFLNYWEKNARQMYSYNISGFNGIIDAGILEERLNELSKHYSRIKEENSDCILYLESAHYLNTKSKMLVFNKLSKYIDILGMNEEELIDFAGQLGFAVDKESLESVLKGLELVSEQYKINGIIMHTKDYSMYYGRELKGIDIEKGLTLGNLMSGTRARIGRYGTYEDCLESLSLELSKTGMAFAEKLSMISTEKNVQLVPSRYMEHPKCTIGLGDTFAAGVQICFTK